MLGVQRRLWEQKVLANDEIRMTNDELMTKPKTARDGRVDAPRRPDATARRPFPVANRVALAAAGPVAIERARDIDRNLLLSVSRQEQNAAPRNLRRNVPR
jgi:hypothetical protein